MKLLFDKGSELVVWSEEESVTLSLNGVKYELEGKDLEYFAEFVKANVSRIEREKDSRVPFHKKLKKIWETTG